MKIDLDYIEQWKGKQTTRTDLITLHPIAGLAATLDRRVIAIDGHYSLPALWHWLYFKPLFLQSETRPDGAAGDPDLLPPVPLPRRMWAGSSLTFHRPLYLGDEVTKTSEVTNITSKEGKSGVLVFVTLRHVISTARGTAITEDHDIVFRDHPREGDLAPISKLAPDDALYSRRIVPDPVFLFRYSALTFNAHRIHYDRSYATETEGYPGLIVHGPLIATLLLDLFSSKYPERRIRKFAFKAMHPLFDLDPFDVCLQPEPGTGDKRFSLWARDHKGVLAMQASCETD